MEMLPALHAMADAARAPALQFFRSEGLSADNKSDVNFDPVTEGDRATEAAIRAKIAELRPKDGILGEEYGADDGSSGITWIIDPIDGTRAYLCGAPTWGVLIAAVQDGSVLCGVIDQPYIGERFWGSSEGAFWQKNATAPVRLKTRHTQSLADARIMTTFPEVGTPNDRAGFEAVAQRTQLTRYGMDCYAYALLAAGQIDVVVEAGLESYDIAGPIAVMEAAGGVVTTWDGSSAVSGGQILAAANKRLHQEALDILAPFAAG
ncbi:MAG: histidinol-phosphatase [Pseudomonadota bacterium]